MPDSKTINPQFMGSQPSPAVSSVKSAMAGDPEKEVKIVQMADEEKRLPDGSRIIYAESNMRIVLHHEFDTQPSLTYIFNRKTGNLEIKDGGDLRLGTQEEKLKMLELGQFFLTHNQDKDLVTIVVQNKGSED